VSTITLDSSGDWDVTGGKLSLTTGINETVQRVAARLLLFKGEWFLDLRQGVPYFEVVLVKNPDLDAIRQMLTNIIATTQGVKSVTQVKLTFDRPKRKLTYAWSAKNDAGVVIEGGEGAPLVVATQGAPRT
jgi:hypothetical protein